jgi:phosphate transport system substrate-binding protein
MVALVALIPACNVQGDTSPDRQVTADSILFLVGAGATFPYPVYTRWFSRFGDSTGVRITYQSVGSGAGVRALLAGTVDFAATDVPLDTTEQRLLRALTIRQVPLVVGGAAVAYHLPALARQLRLDGSVLGDIFLGRITTWNDARIAALNPDMPLPAQQIRVITRADTSGTSWILTDFLSRVHPAWSSGPGRSKYPAWPVGSAIRGNEGVASEIKVTQYSIGVVEAVYAMQNRLPVARIRNHAGAWVTPQTGALRSAASAMLASMDDTVEFATSISDAPGEMSYPIASLSWLIIPTQGRDSTHLAAMRRFVPWALANGNSDALALGYAPLPDSMRATLQRSWPVAPR